MNTQSALTTMTLPSYIKSGVILLFTLLGIRDRLAR